MDAWETLTANSTLELGDAWQHLGAQASGTGVIFIAGDVLLDIEEEAVEIETNEVVEVMAENADQVTVDVEEVVGITVDAAPVIVETC